MMVRVQCTFIVILTKRIILFFVEYFGLFGIRCTTYKYHQHQTSNRCIIIHIKNKNQYIDPSKEVHGTCTTY